MKFFSALLLFATASAAAERPSHDEIRQQWQKTIAQRLVHAEHVTSMIAESADTWHGVRTAANQLGIPEVKYSGWLNRNANISVEEGLRAAKALNAAPWFLLGWDILSKAYRDDDVDDQPFETKPEVLKTIKWPHFRDMVSLARRGWREDLYRPAGHLFEPALCAANLTGLEMVTHLEAKGYYVVKKKPEPPGFW